jgi:hypothetical protein
MQPDDDEFWTTYIASTPEQDADFAPTGRWRGWIVVGAIAIGTIIFLLH